MMPDSMFFLKLRARAGTDSITCGRVSAMAAGTFRRVARAFVPNAAGRAYVRHLNGVLSDNRACNLEWCEEPERSRRRGPKPRMCPVVRIAGDGSVRMFRDVSEAALESGVGAGLIRAAIRRGGRSGGYAWRWA